MKAAGKPTLAEFLKYVAEFAEETYQDFEHAAVVIHHRPGVSDTVLVAFPEEAMTRHRSTARVVS